MGTVAYLFLVIGIILAIVAVVCAVTHRAWTNWVIGAVICLVVWIVFAYLVH